MDAAVDTRSQILEVARELFVTRGFAATTTRELAERLGFTKAALYYHFHTKDDLLAALAEPMIDRMHALVDGTTPTAEPELRASWLATYIDTMFEYRDLIGVFHQDPSAKQGRVADEFAVVFEGMLRLLSGEAEPDAAARTRARATLSAVMGGLVHASADEDPDDVRAATLVAACGALGVPVPSS
ncbi:MAG TPA: helix-turn-helix domain-containing protein [Acidimicrobiales bacterium]|nr:helix-turn-helix domain-containing protein [Acidimicrobiales bacterium]